MNAKKSSLVAMKTSVVVFGLSFSLLLMFFTHPASFANKSTPAAHLSNLSLISLKDIQLLDGQGRTISWHASSFKICFPKAVLFENHKLYPTRKKYDASEWIKKAVITNKDYLVDERDKKSGRPTHLAAVELSDGGMLVVGNIPGQNKLQIWESTPSKKVVLSSTTIDGLSEPQLTLLNNKCVLLSGGVNTLNNCLSTSCYLYDPAQKRTRKICSLQTARKQHSVLQLTDGKILIVGGKINDNQFTGSVEILTDGVSREVGQMATPRAEPLLFKLDRGRALILGGWYETEGVFNDSRWVRDAILFSNNSQV